jgi:hypothetical protein
MAKNAKRKGGARLNRSETVTVRLDPELRYLAELAARKQRRTLSSFIEWGVEGSLRHVYLKEVWIPQTRTTMRTSIADSAAELWDVGEMERLFRLPLQYSELLNHEEQVLWKLLRHYALLWLGRETAFEELTEDLNIRVTRMASRIGPYWEAFKKVAAGEADKSILPAWAEYKEDTEVDDDTEDGDVENDDLSS